MRRLFLTLLFIVVLAAAAPSAYATGTISGALTDLKQQTILQGLTVQVFNPINAVLVAGAVTDAHGGFSIPVPAGEYKLRFSGTVNNDCYDQYYGTGGLDVFDSGTAVTVSDSANTKVDGEISVGKSCGPVLCVPNRVSLKAEVFDSQTQQPVADIQIALLNPITALPFLDPLVTDGNGVAVLSLKAYCGSVDAKLRFSDPNGRYQPEFYGAGGLDSFDFGQTLDLSLASFKQPIALVTPVGMVNDISQQVADLGLDPSVVTDLTRTLSQAVQILADNNPNNDKSACGILNGFRGQLNGDVHNGTLLQWQVDTLAASAEHVRIMLGCK